MNYGWKILLYLLFNLYLNVSTLNCEKLSKIRIKDKWFVDEHDRVVLFHGINVVRKEPPWIPDSNLMVNLTNQTQIDYLEQWGFNVVRLGVMWAGLMPQKNLINYTYLDEMEKIVVSLEKAGMYVIIDLHQDMLSSKL
jgi:endoglycosylceramidase